MFVYLLITGKTEILKNIYKITQLKWPKYEKTKLGKWHEPNIYEQPTFYEANETGVLKWFNIGICFNVSLEFTFIDGLTNKNANLF